MIDKSKHWEDMNMTDEEKAAFYKAEGERIMLEYPEAMRPVMNYEYCELEQDFLGFLHVYATVDVPNDFIVMDFGCNQAVQAQYFEHCLRYYGIDSAVPCEARFGQANAAYFMDSIQEFIKTTLPVLVKAGLDLEKVYAICSYVPDEEAQKLIADTFPYARVVYCDEVICDRKPPVLNFYNSVKLIHDCIDNGILQADPNDKDRVLVYMENTSDNQLEGWYSQNILDSAQDLQYDGEGQRLLLTELAERGVNFIKEDFKTFETQQVFDEAFFKEYLPKQEKAKTEIEQDF